MPQPCLPSPPVSGIKTTPDSTHNWRKLRSQVRAPKHENWAKLLRRDAKPEETARILNAAIKDHGGQGAADMADLLGRFARHDPQKAETLRALVSRRSGQEVPFRIAPMGAGFRELSQEEKLALAPYSPFGPADGADLHAAGNMAKALLKKGDYQDAYKYLKSAPEATPPYMAAVHDLMRRENPGLAMKFAEQGVENGMVRTEPPPNRPDNHRKPQYRDNSREVRLPYLRRSRKLSRKTAFGIRSTPPCRPKFGNLGKAWGRPP